ncbi:MAG: hypothetical protein RL291_1228 [Pseudomonadota bacterium]|jgi:hypothetical protein
MLKRTLIVGGLSVAAVLAADLRPAEAYRCSIPAVRDSIKRAVCGTPALRALDTQETAKLSELRSWLNRNAYNYTEDDRKQFTAQRAKCGAKDIRCLEATYQAQVRLYSVLLGCKAGTRQTACVKNAVQKHRQALHSSM